MPYIYIYQLLDVERRNLKFVHTFLDEDTECTGGLFKCSVQALEQWSQEFDSPSTVPDRLNCFVVEDPMGVDILSVCGCTDADRRKIMVWEAKLSDVEGCTELCNARTLSYTSPLTAKGAPILALLDELASRGIAPVQQRIRHSAECKMEYDHRNVCSTREYLRCVLCLPALLQAGVKEFDSAQTQSLYKLLLLNPAKAQPGLSGKEYKRLLSLEAGEVSCSITSLLKPPAPLAVTAPKQKALPEVAGDDAAAESLETMLEQVLDGTLEGSSSSSEASGSSESSSSSSAETGKEVVGDEVGDEPGFPTHILGQKLILEKHAKHGTEGLRVQCPNLEHRCNGCISKYRSLKLDQHKFGHNAAVFILERGSGRLQR